MHRQPEDRMQARRKIQLVFCDQQGAFLSQYPNDSNESIASGAQKAKGFAGLSTMVGDAGAGDVAVQPVPASLARPDLPGTAAATTEVPENEPNSPEQPTPEIPAAQDHQGSQEDGQGKLLIGIAMVALVAIFFASKSGVPPTLSAPSTPVSASSDQIPSPISAAPVPAEPAPSLSVLESPPVRLDTRPALEMPLPGEGQTLNLAQLRYCVAQGFRIDGARLAVNSADPVAIAQFNAMVEDFNSRCASFRYRAGTLEQAKQSIAPYQAEFELEGRAWFK
jgi:hypothetical protein